jgi:hypothetical protein
MALPTHGRIPLESLVASSLSVLLDSFSQCIRAWTMLCSMRTSGRTCSNALWIALEQLDVKYGHPYLTFSKDDVLERHLSRKGQAMVGCLGIQPEVTE